MARSKRALLWLLLGGLAAGGSAQPPWREAAFMGQTGQTRDEAAELLKVARLERESGHPDKALDLCGQLSRRFPADPRSTPPALILGAEILLEQMRTREARAWTSEAITRFRDQDTFQKRMAVLHRRALAGAPTANSSMRWYRALNTFLWLQWSIRGLSTEEIHERHQRLRAELLRHREDWERPGVEGSGPGAEPPSGMRRILEGLAASLARDVSQAHGQENPLLEEVAGLFRKRIELLQELWSTPAPDPRAQESFDRFMETLDSKIRQLQQQAFRQAALREEGRTGASGRRAPAQGKARSPYEGLSVADLEKKAGEIERQVKLMQDELARLKAELANRRK